MLDIHLGRPLVRGGLTLFPVWNGAAVAIPEYDVAERRVTVVERSGSPSVDTLQVVNVGPRAALLLEGELLVGGLQDRMVAASTMVAPRTRHDLPVRCVERGRWSGATQHAVAGRHAPLALREAGDQDGTWAAVTDIERREGGGATHALADATDGLERRAERLVDGVRPLPFTSGLLVGVGGRPRHLEVFDSPATLAAMWTQLVRAAAMTAVDARPVATTGAQARAFVDQVRRFGGVGAAQGIVRGRAGSLMVTALGWHGRVVHAVAA